MAIVLCATLTSIDVARTDPALSLAQATRLPQTSEAVQPFTVGLLTEGPGKTSAVISDQLAIMAQTDQETGPHGEIALRIRPMSGTGGVQTIRDLLRRPGVDLAIVPVSVLEHARRDPELANLQRKLVYIIKLFPEDVHILTRRSDIKTFADLSGKRVNTGLAEGDVDSQLQWLAASMGIKIEGVHRNEADAIKALRTGEIDAVVMIAAKPAPMLVSTLAEDVNGASNHGSDALHIVSIPFEKLADNTALPSTFTHDDYPDLVGSEEPVDTIAVSSALVAFNWPVGSVRYQLLAGLIQTFLSHFDEFRASAQQPQWREVNVGAVLPGWNRFSPVEHWITNNLVGRSAGHPPPFHATTPTRETLHHNQVKGGSQL